MHRLFRLLGSLRLVAGAGRGRRGSRNDRGFARRGRRRRGRRRFGGGRRTGGGGRAGRGRRGCGRLDGWTDRVCGARSEQQDHQGDERPSCGRPDRHARSLDQRSRCRIVPSIRRDGSRERAGRSRVRFGEASTLVTNLRVGLAHRGFSPTMTLSRRTRNSSPKDVVRTDTMSSYAPTPSVVRLGGRRSRASRPTPRWTTSRRRAAVAPCPRNTDATLPAA